jgi:hypothetical protein
MIARPLQVVFALVLGLMVAGVAGLGAQEPGKTKDDALDSLLERLTGPGDGPASKSAKAAGASESAAAKKGRSGRSPAGSKDAPGSTPTADKTGKGPADKSGKPSVPKAGTVAPKDQAIDDLLEKLGETRDTPTPEERQRNPGALPPKDPPPAEKTSPAKLGGKDKDIDDQLEEIAGRKKKRPAADEQRDGPIGEIIKEMRDVEQRLGKPDPSEDTQNKQKQIVRHIDTLIEQVRQSGSSAAGLRVRRVRQPGQQPGQQPGDQTGALARGAPAMKPAKPSSQHSTAGGKDIWGHLPAELRHVMENSFKEMGLGSKEEMISRYFLSIGKGKLVRQE